VVGVRSGPPRACAADEQVQWTCESDERREHRRAAGEMMADAPFGASGRVVQQKFQEIDRC
jgi:hypothetical protein